MECAAQGDCDSVPSATSKLKYWRNCPNGVRRSRRLRPHAAECRPAALSAVRMECAAQGDCDPLPYSLPLIITPNPSEWSAPLKAIATPREYA